MLGRFVLIGAVCLSAAAPIVAHASTPQLTCEISSTGGPNPQPTFVAQGSGYGRHVSFTITTPQGATTIRATTTKGAFSVQWMASVPGTYSITAGTQSCSATE